MGVVNKAFAQAHRVVDVVAQVPVEGDGMLVGRSYLQVDLGAPDRRPELGTIDLVLLTNPRTEQRPAVRALIATVLASGSRTLAAYRDQYSAAPAT